MSHAITVLLAHFIINFLLSLRIEAFHFVFARQLVHLCSRIRRIHHLFILLLLLVNIHVVRHEARTLTIYIIICIDLLQILELLNELLVIEAWIECVHHGFLELTLWLVLIHLKCLLLVQKSCLIGEFPILTVKNLKLTGQSRLAFFS